MTNKQKYKKFCQKENLPVFMSSDWLDNVCTDSMEWDVILYEKGGKIWGSFVYTIKKQYGFSLILMPKLTQYLGPYIKYPEGQKYYKRLSWEKEIMNYFIDNLPKFDYLNINFHYSITNWLPFFWKGFNQVTRYSYIITNNITLNELSRNFETDIRRRRRKAEKFGVIVENSEDIELLYNLASMTFNRQKVKIPYTLNLLKKLYYNNKENLKINLAKYNGNYIAGNLLLISKDSIIYLIGGVDPNYKDLGAMDLIQYESIKFALENNKKFDFEGSMIESIEKYFRGFGGIQTQYFKINKISSIFLRFILIIYPKVIK